MTRDYAHDVPDDDPDSILPRPWPRAPFHPVPDPDVPAAWRVDEVTRDREAGGTARYALFLGSDCKKRAFDYANWRNGLTP